MLRLIEDDTAALRENANQVSPENTRTCRHQILSATLSAFGKT